MRPADMWSRGRLSSGIGHLGLDTVVVVVESMYGDRLDDLMSLLLPIGRYVEDKLLEKICVYLYYIIHIFLA